MASAVEGLALLWCCGYGVKTRWLGRNSRIRGKSKVMVLLAGR